MSQSVTFDKDLGEANEAEDVGREHPLYVGVSNVTDVFNSFDESTQRD